MHICRFQNTRSTSKDTRRRWPNRVVHLATLVVVHALPCHGSTPVLDDCAHSAAPAEVDGGWHALPPHCPPRGRPRRRGRWRSAPLRFSPSRWCTDGASLWRERGCPRARAPQNMLKTSRGCPRPGRNLVLVSFDGGQGGSLVPPHTRESASLWCLSPYICGSVSAFRAVAT